MVPLEIEPAPAAAPPSAAPSAPTPSPAPAVTFQAAPAASEPLAALPAPVAPVVALVPAEPLAGFSDGNAFLRSPDNDFILFPNGRLQVDSYLFRYSGDKDKAKIPNNTFLLRRARLELGGWMGPFVYFWLAGDFALGPAGGGGAGRPLEHRDHRQLRRARPLEQPGDPAGRPVRRPLHAREPDVGQVLRLHGALDHRARVRHPRQQGDGRDAARLQRQSELLLLARAVERRRAELQERRPRSSTGWGVPGWRRSRSWATARCTTWRSAARSGPAIARTRWRRPHRRRRAGSPSSASASSTPPTTARPTRRCSCGRSAG